MWLVHLKLYRYVALRLWTLQRVPTQWFQQLQQGYGLWLHLETYMWEGLLEEHMRISHQAQWYVCKSIRKAYVDNLAVPILSYIHTTYRKDTSHCCFYVPVGLLDLGETWDRWDPCGARRLVTRQNLRRYGGLTSEWIATIEKLETTIKDYDATTKANKA